MNSFTPCTVCRGNHLGHSGWDVVMDNLSALTSVTSFNGMADLGTLFMGGQTNVNLRNKDLSTNEAVVAVARLLQRSDTTLIKLDLRCHCMS